MKIDSSHQITPSLASRHVPHLILCQLSVLHQFAPTSVIQLIPAIARSQPLSLLIVVIVDCQLVYRSGPVLVCSMSPSFVLLSSLQGIWSIWRWCLHVVASILRVPLLIHHTPSSTDIIHYAIKTCNCLPPTLYKFFCLPLHINCQRGMYIPITPIHPIEYCTLYQ